MEFSSCTLKKFDHKSFWVLFLQIFNCLNFCLNKIRLAEQQQKFLEFFLTSVQHFTLKQPRTLVTSFELKKNCLESERCEYCFAKMTYHFCMTQISFLNIIINCFHLQTVTYVNSTITFLRLLLKLIFDWF